MESGWVYLASPCVYLPASYYLYHWWKQRKKEKLVGSYENNFDGIVSKLVFLENGKVETFFNDLKIDEETWNISGTEVFSVLIRAKEVHIGVGSPIDVYKIESNGDLTLLQQLQTENEKKNQEKLLA